MFTPDGVGNYDALWVRDFAYMAEYVGDLMGEKAIGDCIRFILRGQRADGWFPDQMCIRDRGYEIVTARGDVKR